MTDQARLGWFLTGMGVRDYIATCAQRALRGQTPAPLREYSFAFDEAAKRITFRAEVERELSEDERENLAVVETEIYADFGDDTLVETEVVVVPMGLPLHPLPGGVAFVREGEQAALAPIPATAA